MNDFQPSAQSCDQAVVVSERRATRPFQKEQAYRGRELDVPVRLLELEVEAGVVVRRVHVPVTLRVGVVDPAPGQSRTASTTRPKHKEREKEAPGSYHSCQTEPSYASEKIGSTSLSQRRILVGS